MGHLASRIFELETQGGDLALESVLGRGGPFRLGAHDPELRLPVTEDAFEVDAGLRGGGLCVCKLGAALAKGALELLLDGFEDRGERGGAVGGGGVGGLGGLEIAVEAGDEGLQPGVVVGEGGDAVGEGVLGLVKLAAVEGSLVGGLLELNTGGEETKGWVEGRKQSEGVDGLAIADGDSMEIHR